ncbi:LysR family transcriptional regulator [Xylanimonas allomyrinae]|uniref:LysR family transcriptional regulator n=1 Tax=Xylanimonas allomyrinae TaxID=2509459 RepID=A0A4P6EQR2_9MICO|nr:LysR family transcriptional regulator [Xylanimonas allomyrinae]QAY62647.1 LysR family transcriptional regulator [Xylanimonas allomyrinae]
MPADLDLTRLRVLAAVARTGSVTAAARELGVAQPSVSHHLSRLESEAGLPLLERAGRGIHLTEAGRLLAVRAEEILGRVASVRLELDALAGLRAGRARLAAFPSALATIVPTAIAALVRDHPGLSVGLVEAEPPEAVDALAAGEVDVALVFEHSDVPHAGGVEDLARYSVTPVLDEPVHLVRPAADDDGSFPPLAALSESDWIAGCPRCRADLVARCGAAGFAPRITFETDDSMAVQALVAAGVGVSLLPELALRAHRSPGVVTSALPGARRRVLALTLGKPTPPARELLVRLVAAGAAHRGAPASAPSGAAASAGPPG